MEHITSTYSLDNIIIDNGYDGIAVEVNGNAAIINNTINNNTSSGIDFRSSTQAEIKNNIITNSKEWGGIYVPSDLSGQVHLSYNDVWNNLHNGEETNYLRFSS